MNHDRRTYPERNRELINHSKLVARIRWKEDDSECQGGHRGAEGDTVYMLEMDCARFYFILSS